MLQFLYLRATFTDPHSLSGTHQHPWNHFHSKVLNTPAYVFLGHSSLILCELPLMFQPIGLLCRNAKMYRMCFIQWNSVHQQLKEGRNY